MSVPRIFLVGESNPYGSDPKFALYPLPAHATGGRLARVLGMTDREYLRAFERRNLLVGDRWSVPAARGAANAILLQELRLGDRVVLLGARVAAAFGCEFRSNLCTPRLIQLGTGPLLQGHWTLVIPHPSGRSREWNDSNVRQSVKEAVERICEESVDSLRPDPESPPPHCQVRREDLSENDKNELDKFERWMRVEADRRAADDPTPCEAYDAAEMAIYPEGVGRSAKGGKVA